MRGLTRKEFEHLQASQVDFTVAFDGQPGDPDDPVMLELAARGLVRVWEEPAGVDEDGDELVTPMADITDQGRLALRCCTVTP